MSDSQRFEGFDRPRYTPTPDALFDELLPDLSLVELRVLLYIIRRTFGFKKDSDAISVAQMESGIVTRDGRRLDRGTGLSTAGVRKGLRGLLDRGVIVALQNTDEAGASLPTTYALRFKDEGGAHASTEGVYTRTPSPDTGVHPSPAQVNTHNKQSQETEEQEDSKFEFEIFIRNFANEFRDRAPIQSTLTRAQKLLDGVDYDTAYDALYEARKRTRSATNVKNRTAFFFKVLENLIDEGWTQD